MAQRYGLNTKYYCSTVRILSFLRTVERICAKIRTNERVTFATIEKICVPKGWLPN